MPFASFYPTYEEWKQPCFTIAIRSFIPLFILPMRNGNKIKEVEKELKEKRFLSYL